jgi:hypothetical protein
MLRFHNFGVRPLDPALADRTLEPRLNQVFIPLMSIIADGQARTALQRIAREYQRQLVADWTSSTVAAMRRHKGGASPQDCRLYI